MHIVDDDRNDFGISNSAAKCSTVLFSLASFPATQRNNGPLSCQVV